MSKNNPLNQQLKRGFTVVELLVVAPIVLLTIGAFITVVVNMVGDVLASRSSSVLTYNIQDALDRIESDIKLSTTFLAQSNVTLSSPQGFNNDTTAFNNVDTTNGDMLILNTLATSANPLSATASLIYLTNQPNGCTSTQVAQNTPMTMNVIYFVKNNTLWRRNVMPSNYATAGCSVPWQQPSCNPAYMAANPGAPIAFCKSKDIDLVDNINPSDFHIQYYSTADGTTVNTVASDTAQSVAARNTSLQSSTTVGASITVNTTAAGRSISQSGSIRATKLDVNASTIAPVVTPTIPSAPTVTASLSQPTSVVFTWPTVTGATGYTIDYNINGGAWTNGFANQNSTTFTPPSCATSSSPCTGNSNVVNARVSATNSAGTSSYGTASLTIPLWNPIVFQNSWTNYNPSWTSAAYTKTSSGMISLKGMVKGGSGVIGVLPVGYRPTYRLIFENISNQTPGRLDIFQDGSIEMDSPGSNAWFSLDGVNFMPSSASFTAATPLVNGWTVYSAPYNIPPGYLTDATGRVVIQGMVYGGTASSTIATLPSALHPALYAHFHAMDAGATGHFSIDTGGNLLAKGFSNAWLAMHAIYFPYTYGSATTCATPGLHVDNGWCSMTLQNGWINYNASVYQTAGYTRASDGLVTLKGLLSSGSTSAVIATLPAGYRPATQLLMATQSAGSWARLDIHTDGTILAAANVNSGWLSLDGMTFMAEQ